MFKDNEIQSYLPLTEASFYIMLVLVKPAHGYAIMEKVKDISKGKVIIGPGTLYGAFTTLEKEKLIEKAGEEERRKYYKLTVKGKAVLHAYGKRLKLMMSNYNLLNK